MAKKKATENPFVPAEEQPYEIPDNWCWVYVGAVCLLIGGGTPDKLNPAYWNGDIPWASVKDIKGDFLYSTKDRITVDGFNNGTSIRCDVNDLILVTRIKPGKTIVSKISTTVNQDLKVVKSWLPSRFLHYYFTTFRHEFERKSSGSTVRGITVENVDNTPFPLPPLPEQQRIVSLIESLFAKLDEAKEKAQAVVDGFELRKSAILHKAFTGELTARWRKEHGVGKENWKETTIGACSELITKGASPRWQGVAYTEDKIQTLFITSENVREGYLDMTKEKYLDNKINDIQKRSILKKGDVLVNIVGASIGRSAIFDLDVLGNTNQAVCIIRLNKGFSNRFICHYLNSPTALQYYDSNKVETARANISLTDITNMGICIPSLDEQAEIVRIIDELVSREQKAKDAAEAVLDQIDTMKKAILARAFCGELGTNDPKEEWAGELVKKLLG